MKSPRATDGSASHQENVAMDQQVEISDDAKKRLRDCPRLAAKVYSVINEESRRLGVRPKLTVRPAWSHEYEDPTVVVIEAEITGDNNRRFALWDAIASKLDALLDFLSPEERTFLTDNIVVVTRP